MYGIVIWENISAGQAIIWCDDQADLAFFDAAQAEEKLPAILRTNDEVVVQFCDRSGYRRVTRIVQHWASNSGQEGMGLGGALMDQGEEVTPHLRLAS